MENFLSRRITELQESATIRMAKLARELKASGKDIIDLSLGEPDFDTPEFVREAAKKAIDDGYTHYTPVSGYPELRKAIVRKLKEENGLEYSAEQIVTSTGAKQSIANAVLCLVNPGDEVIVPAPYWVSYAAIVQLAEGVIVEIPTGIDQGFKVTAEQLEARITPRTKLIMYSSPSNPTGALYSYEELQSIAAMLSRHPNVLVLSDEIYEYINFTGKPHTSLAQFPGMQERVILVNGLSKGFAMTGWRLGYIAAPLWLAKACDKMQGQFTSATCSITQKAAEVAVVGSKEETRNMVKIFQQRRDMVYQRLSQVSGLRINLPDGAFYFFPDVRDFFGKSYQGNLIKNPEDMSMYLLSEAGVSTVSGEAFGDPYCIRFSYATAEDKLTQACDRIIAALQKLN